MDCYLCLNPEATYNIGDAICCHEYLIDAWVCMECYKVLIPILDELGTNGVSELFEKIEIGWVRK